MKVNNIFLLIIGSAMNCLAESIDCSFHQDGQVMCSEQQIEDSQISLSSSQSNVGLYQYIL